MALYTHNGATEQESGMGLLRLAKFMMRVFPWNWVIRRQNRNLRPSVKEISGLDLYRAYRKLKDGRK